MNQRIVMLNRNQVDQILAWMTEHWMSHGKRSTIHIDVSLSGVCIIYSSKLNSNLSAILGETHLRSRMDLGAMMSERKQG